MKKVFLKVIESNDIDVVKNCFSIIAESSEIGMNDECLLETMKAIEGEVDTCHYDEDMTKIHLCLIGELSTMDDAKDYWQDVKDNYNINIWDWCVLWGEMKKQNEKKIKEWFPNIRAIDFEKKIYEECLTFLRNNKTPYDDISL